MSSKIIIYKTEIPNNAALVKYLKEFTNWAKPFENVWIVTASNKSASKIRDEIKEILGKDAHILVMEFTHNGWGTSNISKEVTNWMKEKL